MRCPSFAIDVFPRVSFVRCYFARLTLRLTGRTWSKKDGDGGGHPHNMESSSPGVYNRLRAMLETHFFYGIPFLFGKHIRACEERKPIKQTIN